MITSTIVQVSYDAEVIFNEGELYARVVWGWELLDSLREDHLSATARSMILRALEWSDIKKDVIS